MCRSVVLTATAVYLEPRHAATSSGERQITPSASSGLVALIRTATTASTAPVSRAACMRAVATPPEAPAWRTAPSDAQPNQSQRQGPRKSSLGAPSLRSRHQAPGEKSRPSPGHAPRGLPPLPAVSYTHLRAHETGRNL